MRSLTFKIVVVSLLPLAALAESTSESNSNSSSGVYIGGSSRTNTPSVGGSSNNTSSCIIGNHVGIGVEGLGFSVGAGRVDKECNVREEAKALLTLLGRRAAIAHLCKHDKSIQETLVEQGYCVVKKK